MKRSNLAVRTHALATQILIEGGRAVGLRYRRMRSSMLAAIERKRTPAIDFLNGEVVIRGAEAADVSLPGFFQSLESLVER